MGRGAENKIGHSFFRLKRRNFDSKKIIKLKTISFQLIIIIIIIIIIIVIVIKVVIIMDFTTIREQTHCN